jgi:hypothetical protein
MTASPRPLPLPLEPAPGGDRPASDPRPRRARRFGLAALLPLLFWCTPAQAQTWVALSPGAPVGQPAELQLLPASGSQQSEFELVLHGYFRQTLTGPDGVTYTRFDFPGLGLVDQTGAPELPALRPTLALPTSASAAQLTGLSVAPGDLITVSARVYPQPEPALDDGDPGAGDPDGTPEQFSFDGALYGSSGPWPAQQASAAAAPGLLLSGARGARPELFPVRFDPALNRVLIARRTRYTYAHVGASSSTPLSRDQRRLLSLEAVNFSAVSGLYPEAGPYLGRYAIVAPAAFAPALAPWIEHRRATGFEVALLTLESLPGSGAAAIRAGLAAWSAAGPPNAERYALLVGDADLLPPASAPTPGAPPSDDPYGSPSGSPQGTESIFVGRWPVDNAGQIPGLIARQIAYELDKDPGHHYGRVTLATHQAGAPGGFQAEAQALLSGSYAAPLGFSTQFGSQASSSDQAVLGQLAQGRGLLCYRGHGTSNSWAQFGVVGGDLGTLHKDDLAALSTPFAPVVWSLSCHQGAIDLGDSLGETWLLANAGALAHYGAARSTQNRGNRRLLRELFELAFDAGLRTQGPLLALAEERLAAALPKSPDGWLYGLLGCPATRLRAAPPRPLDLLLPSVVPLCSGACPQVIGVVDAAGAPVPSVLVSAYKPPFDPALPTELLVAFQAGPSGPVSIPLGPQTLGTINVTGRDDDGNVAQEFVQAKSGAFTKLGQGTPGTQGAPRLSSQSDLTPGLPAQIRLEDGRPFAAALLAGSLGQSPLPVYGGILYPSLPFAAEFLGLLDIAGDSSWAFVPWPPNCPSGLTVCFQAGVLDAEALPGVALSNALLGVTP